MDAANRIIPARSRREVMDWSLVLASQEIEAMIVRTEAGWGLAVEEGDYERAQAALGQYRTENRGWRWKQRLPGSGLVFHRGAVVWAAGMAAFYYWTMVAFPQLQGAGIMDNEKVAAGQWWRLFTAITLHENLPHLAANALTGLLLLGLAMARYGPGVALLAAFIAGAAGNGLDLLIRSDDSQSLGASGMVTGALGMLSVHSFSLWRKYRAARILIMRGAAAGFLILVLIGFAPGSDIAAHVGGFLAGAVIGLALNAARPAAWQGGWVNVAGALALAALLAVAWREALASS
ncbi:MAG TPA: rhomboid family intramembrane serine protease [Candidatus Acidoferrum sp.]|nr:rhomboid family intramembrane serine protease [Candidatus Acidoferrum sp.]